MYHSIIFEDDKNTWADWYLIPSSRPVFNPPEVKTKIVDIPGADWHLDLSTILTGEINFGSRTGSLEFIVDNGQLSDYNANKWSAVYSEILGYLHGQILKARLEDDPYYYYEGRFTVNQWASESHNSKITIDYDVAPYKYEAESSLENWKWDTFNFESGIIRNYKNMEVVNSKTLTIVGRRMSVTPTFIVKTTHGQGMRVRFNNKIYQLPEGESRVLDIRTVEGKNTLTFIGVGTVSVNYRGGCL